MEFTHLMNRFYGVARDVLVEHDAIIEKFVGDEVVGLSFPLLAGSEHARRALEAAIALLEATGHRSADAPWAPLGAGVHTGTAFVGVVGAKDALDFTALGDRVNIAAHLASQAAAGEILYTDEVAKSAGRMIDGVERRAVALKGFDVDALVLRSQSSQLQAGRPRSSRSTVRRSAGCARRAQESVNTRSRSRP